jgi:hypothetical protein
MRTIPGPILQLHIGLLYRTEDSEALLLNLRSHLDLRNEMPSNEYRWIQVDLDEINRRLIVALCRLIAKKNQRIPFGFTFTYSRSYFSRSGDYIPGDLGEGLTCATFVMAVFNTYEIPLLKIEEWPLPRLEDMGWQTGQARGIGRQFGAIIAAAIEEAVGSPRFLPEHVTAGATSPDRPVGYQSACALGDRIRRALLRSY